MEEWFFVYEEKLYGRDISIKLTKVGWDSLSRSEKTRLLRISAGKAKDATAWIHGKQDPEVVYRHKKAN